MENKKKNKILKILGLVGLFVLVFGLSYALFRVTLTGRKKTRIKTANFGLTLTDINGNKETEGIAVDLQNALPETDEEGLARDGYKFVVTNTGNIPTSYELKLNSTGDLNTEYIKYTLIEKDYLKKANGDYYLGGIYSNQSTLTYENYTLNETASPLLSNLSNNKLDGTTLLPGEKIEYELKLWLDCDAGIAASNKTYEANVVIDGSQAEEYMTGPTGDNANYTLYKDGTLTVTGTGAIKTVDMATGQIYNNGGATLAVTYNILKEKGYEININDNAEASILTIINFALYGGAMDRKLHNNYSDLHGDIQSMLSEYFGDNEIAEQIWNEIASHKITRAVIDEGITSTVYTYGFNDYMGNYMFTMPSTLSDIGCLRFFNLGYVGYGLIIPENITTIPEEYQLGAYIRYLDLNNVQTIEKDGISNIYFIKELTIPNTVTRIEEDGISAAHDMTINIDNTREYVESHWDSNWLDDNGHNVTINYLR